MPQGLDNSSAVSVRNVSKSFGAVTVLDDINFDVAEGEIVVLLGASGSGKTTILRIISGLEASGTGEIILHGNDVTNLPARLRGTGVIFQSYALFPKMNVEQNIAYGLKLRRRSKSDIKNTIDRLVEMVHLEEHRTKYPSQLSGGQQQRVAIARALAYEPKVLLFDEPFGALDAQIRATLRREIRSLLKKIRVPSIFITHDQEEALELGDRIAVLNSGRIEQIGTPFEVYSNPATEYVATFLGSANLIRGVVRGNTFQAGDISVEIGDDKDKFRDGQAATLVVRPEDVFLRRPENLMQNYQKLTDGVIEELSFVGAYERVGVRLGGEQKSIIATRPKTETAAFHLQPEQTVTVGVVRFRVLPDHTKPTLYANRAS